jgi:hypothetical protein
VLTPHGMVQDVGDDSGLHMSKGATLFPASYLHQDVAGASASRRSQPDLKSVDDSSEED